MKSRAVAFLRKAIDEVALIAGVERALDLNTTYRKEAVHAGCWRIRDHRKRCANAPWNILQKKGDCFAALVKIAGKPKF